MVCSPKAMWQLHGCQKQRKLFCKLGDQRIGSVVSQKREFLGQPTKLEVYNQEFNQKSQQFPMSPKAVYYSYV